MKIWTTKDLLYLILEFKGLVSNSNNWNEESLSFNQPRLVRFKRINALLMAFELTRSEKQKEKLWTGSIGNKKFTEGEITQNEITPFLRGDFINKRESAEYPNIRSLIEKVKMFESDSFETFDIYTFYHHIMKYRIEIDKILRHNNQVLVAGSLGLRTAISVTSSLNRELAKMVEKIEEILFEIINPKKLTFGEDSLIKEYDFPDEDLDEIDLENF